MTGLITSSYAVEDLSALLTGLRQGTFGIIIDGLDEGRSKTNEKAFEAFLDDLVKLSVGSPRTTFLLLGRTQTVEDCWVYLTDKNVSVGLASLDPFTLEKARQYIDKFSDSPTAGQTRSYQESRDKILSLLSGAFADSTGHFLSFIGYPPVLDAIATLLREEKNYHKIAEELAGSASVDVEMSHLNRVVEYILRRERDEKVIPNLVTGLASELDSQAQAAAFAEAFNIREQCVRLVTLCLGEEIQVSVFGEPALDSAYEAGVESFLTQHPFVVGREFRNAVFEGMSLAVLLSSGRIEDTDLAVRYHRTHKSNYHLIYLLKSVAPNVAVSSDALHVLIGAALEFRSTKALSDVVIEPQAQLATGSESIIDLSVEISAIDSGETSHKFVFSSSVRPEDIVEVGQKLQSCFIELPCGISLTGSELEFVAPVSLSGRSIDFRGENLIVKASPGEVEGDRLVLFEAATAESSLIAISLEGAEFQVALDKREGHAYPLVKHLRQRTTASYEGDVKESYLKLRKILTHFRSHSKGSLAKYRDKVENERVAGNTIGSRVLNKFLADEILFSEGNFYFLKPENVDRHLGVSWTALRAGTVSAKLADYLQSIVGPT